MATNVAFPPIVACVLGNDRYSTVRITPEGIQKFVCDGVIPWCYLCGRTDWNPRFLTGLLGLLTTDAKGGMLAIGVPGNDIVITVGDFPWNVVRMPHECDATTAVDQFQPLREEMYGVVTLADFLTGKLCHQHGRDRHSVQPNDVIAEFQRLLSGMPDVSIFEGVLYGGLVDNCHIGDDKIDILPCTNRAVWELMWHCFSSGQCIPWNICIDDAGITVSVVFPPSETDPKPNITLIGADHARIAVSRCALPVAPIYRAILADSGTNERELNHFALCYISGQTTSFDFAQLPTSAVAAASWLSNRYAGSAQALYALVSVTAQRCRELACTVADSLRLEPPSLVTVSGKMGALETMSRALAKHFWPCVTKYAPRSEIAIHLGLATEALSRHLHIPFPEALKLLPLHDAEL